MILSPEECGCPLSDGGTSISNSPVCSGLALFMILIEGYLKGRCDIATPCQIVESVDKMEQEYDFIVVGAGAAGAIVAGRLSENKKFKWYRERNPGREIPSRFILKRLMDNLNKLGRFHRRVPQPQHQMINVNNDELDILIYFEANPKNSVREGGSNLLNGMMYHRGHAPDYEDWVKAGAVGWSWEENKKYFYMTEGNKQVGTLVNASYHSSNGTLPIQQFNEQPHFLYEILNAINETGLPVLSDMNDPYTPDGFVIAQTMSDDGQRVTTARAYLKPQSERPNLNVKTNAHVTRVLLDGKNAYGVEYINENGETKTITASKEVILSAGALNSPHILLLSGIGPKETLDKFKIPLIADLPVGKNLRNHVGLTLYFLVTKMNNTQILDWSVFTEYMLERNGPMSSTGITQLTGILYSSLADRSRDQPDLQFFFNGFYAECSKTGQIDEVIGDGDCYLNGRNISANGVLLLPRSIGYLTLKSTNPLDPPLFFPNFFDEPEDMVMAKDAARYLQKIFESDTMKNKYGVILDPEYTQGCDSSKEWSDAWIECMTRLHTDAQNHQLGTAAMGMVIDPELKVYGVSGLRVIDASSMPTQPSGNPQGAIMLVAEKGAVLK
ncbi:glucose dehydrogenase [FAD, quinone]-like [Hyposmocoma kahamanoa]|uniref:glucose dehydrogenase [FAD, quinone]-like n=1 Tax=Hyposmocoma kahamanoa TaxID=1477025 RepID=UPI000E6D93A9|nr:glucose dehydrogenase [FAD, quinone]-like [Hyposmocoma kahamanoa]